MCGRFTLTQPEQIPDCFGVQPEQIPPPRYNIAPSQPVGVILQRADLPREYRLQQWGLIPAWAKDPAIAKRLINARAETAHEKPAFRAAFRRRRCLIPADGFYEWKPEKQGKQPYYFHLPQHQVFAFAGLWDSWQEIETFTILTTAANAAIQPIHHRMPVILAPEVYEEWLDPTLVNSDRMAQLMHRNIADTMEHYAVSTQINNPKVDYRDCLSTVDKIP